MAREVLKNWYNAVKKRDDKTDQMIADEIGISRVHLGQIVNDDVMPSFVVGVRLAAILGITADHLLVMMLESPARAR